MYLEMANLFLFLPLFPSSSRVNEIDREEVIVGSVRWEPTITCLTCFSVEP